MYVRTETAELLAFAIVLLSGLLVVFVFAYFAEVRRHRAVGRYLRIIEAERDSLRKQLRQAGTPKPFGEIKHRVRG